MNDYYQNNDSPNSNSYYDVKEPNDMLEFFTVKMMTQNIVLMCIALAVCLYINYIMYKVSRVLGEYGTIFMIVDFLITGIMVFFMFSGLGRKIEVMGRSVVITRCFFFKENITLNDISHCDLKTGLVTGGKIQRPYNSFVIYYCYGGKNAKIEVTDIGYDNWNRLVHFMENMGKNNHIDGRNGLSKFFDGFR